MISQLSKAIMAETAETAIANFHLPSWLSEADETIMKTLRRDGIAIIPAFYTATEVTQLRNEIDRLVENMPEKLWVDSEQSDHRFFGAHRFSPLLQKYLEHPWIQRLGTHYVGGKFQDKITLAARMQFRPGNQGSGAGWHRDSPIRRQFKSLLYLSDVGPGNGPFEYLKGSHRKESVVGLVYRGLQQFRQYRFSNDEVIRIEEQTNNPRMQVLGKAGDLVLVDTKGIHRGSPMLEGSRYALTNYFWRTAMPDHFKELIR